MADNFPILDWHDGDTPYEGSYADGDRRGLRLNGANTVEKGIPGWREATDASVMATLNGYDRKDLEGEGGHGRGLVAFRDEQGNDLSQALVNTGLAAPMGGDFNGGVNPDQDTARRLVGVAAKGIEADPAFQYMAQQAREKRLADLNDLIRGGRLDRMSHQMPDAKTNGGLHGLGDVLSKVPGESVARGVDNMQGTLYGFANALGSVAGIDMLEKFGADGMAQNIYEAAQNPARVAQWDDVDGFADAGIYALEAISEFSPQLAGDAVAFLATGGTATAGRLALAGLGKAILRNTGGELATAGASKIAQMGFAQWGKVGAAASMYAQSAGETQMEFANEGIDASGQALLIGGAKAALDYTALSHVLGEVGKRFAKEAAGDQTTHLLGRMIGATLRTSGATAEGMAHEGVTEMAQTFMDELAKAGNKDGYQIDYNSIIDAGIKGGIVGGTMQGGGHIAAGLYRRQRDAVPTHEVSGGSPEDTQKISSSNPTDIPQVSNSNPQDTPVEQPAATAPVQDTAPEPRADIEAQIAHTAEGQGNWYTAENAEVAKEVAAAQGKAVVEHTDGSVSVGAPEVVNALPETPTQQDIANLVGYHETKEAAAADPQGTTVVRVVDGSGNVINSQAVGTSKAAEVVEAQKRRYNRVEGGRVETVTPEQEVAERSARVADEKTRAEDIPALTKEAQELGIDTQRFHGKGFGEAVVSGLRSAVLSVSAKTRRDDLSAIAPVLGLEPSDLKVETYARAKKQDVRNHIWKLIDDGIKAAGGQKAVAEKIDAMPRREARKIQQALGMEQEGGIDTMGLRAAIAERMYKEPGDGANPLAEPEAAKPQLARKPTLHEALINKTKQHSLIQRALYKSVKGKSVVRNAEEIDRALEAMTPQEQQRMMADVEKLGLDGQHKQAFMRAVSEAMTGREESVETGVGRSQFVDEEQRHYDDDGADVTPAGDDTLVPTEGLREGSHLRRNSPERLFLDTLSKTSLKTATKSGDNIGLSTYLQALAHVAKAGEHDEKQHSAYSEDQQLRVNRAQAMAPLVDVLTKNNPLISRDEAMKAVVEYTGISDSDILAALPTEQREALEGQEGLAHAALGKLADTLRANKGHVNQLIDLMVAGMEIPYSAARTSAEARSIGLEDMRVAMREDPARAIAQLDTYLDAAIDKNPTDDNSRLINRELLMQRNLRPEERDPSRDMAVDRDEQQMADETFFHAVDRAIATNWAEASIPSNPEALHFGERGGASEAITKKVNGANLLEVTLTHGGKPRAGVLDAVALANIAQSGEHKPATPTEAAFNLLENLARMALGPESKVSKWADMTLEQSTNAAFAVPEDTVIFINPQGETFTFGEAMAGRSFLSDGRARVVAAEVELRKLSSQATETTETMFSALRDIEDTAAKRDLEPSRKLAVEAWVKNLTYGEPRPPKHYGEDGSTLADAEAAKKHYDAIGRTTKVKLALVDRKTGKLLPEKEMTLSEAYSHHLQTLGEIKRLNLELDELKDAGLTRNAPDEADLAETFKKKAGSDRAFSEYFRAEKQHDEGHPDHGADAPRETRDDEFANRERQPEANGLEGLGRDEFYANVRANQSEALDALVSALNDAKPRDTSVAQAKDEAPRNDKADVESGPFVVRTPEPKAAAGKDRIHFAPEGWKVQPFIDQLRAKGVPLPHLQVASVSGQSVSEVQSALGVKADTPLGRAIERGLSRGESFYVQDGSDKAVVVLAARTGPRAAQHAMVDLAHELGHAVKDQVWSQLTTEHRDALETAFTRDTGKEPNDLVLHEWFADQFAQVALDKTIEGDSKPKTLIDKAIQMLATAARALWAEVRRHAPAVTPEFREFAHSLFGGTYETLRRQPGEASALFPQVRYADGHMDQAPVNRLKMTVNGAKQAWQKGTLPAQPFGRALLRTAIGRIRTYSPELAGMLFQSAGQMGSRHGRAYEQHQRALNSRMQSIYSPVLEEIRKGAGRSRTLKDAAVREAFEDVLAGSPKTENGKKVRAMIDALMRTAKEDGLTAELKPDFVPTAFDREAVIARQGEFLKLLEDKLDKKITAEERRAMVDRIVDGVGFIEGAIAPGMPVGMHESTQSIIDAVGRDELLKGKWLLRQHDAALNHWISGAAKRAAWEAKFGGEVDPVYGIHTKYDPSAKFKAELEKIRAKHGDMAAQETLDLVNGALGRHPSGRSMPAGLRKAQDALVTWVGFTTLAFSGIASIPELGLPMLRGAGKVGLFEAFKNIGEANRYARDMGIVMSDASEQLMWQMMGDQYESTRMTKAAHVFFKLNGNQAIVRLSRILGTSVAMRFLLRAAEQGDHGALGQLNIDAGTIKAWDAMGKPVWREGMPADQAAVAGKVADAINQFVNEATLNPSRFQATHWGNNPYAKTIWHLKQFLFTYADTVLGFMGREMARRWKGLEGASLGNALAIAAPLLAFGFFVLPLGLATMSARDWTRKLNGQKPIERDALGYVKEMFMSAGGLGPLNLLDQMRQNIEWGRSPLLSLSPTWSRVDGLFTTDKKHEMTRDQLMKNLSTWVPIMAQNPGLNPTRP